MTNQGCSYNLSKSSHFKLKTLSTSVLLALFGFNHQYATAEEAEADLEKIVVTGQKYMRTLQEVPASVSVFNAEKMENLDVDDFSEILFETANVQSTPNGFNIRGIDNQNVSGAGNSNLASVYIDEAPIPHRLMVAGISTWDISQVEIYRGPQSTIQGRNSLAGAVAMTSQAPAHEWGGKYRLELGQNGQQEGAIAIGGGLVEDQLAFRFSGEKESFDGFNFNPTRNENADFIDNELYRLKFLYTPSALPDLSLQLSFTRTENTLGDDAVNALENGQSFETRVITNNDPQQTTTTGDIVSLLANYDINDIWRMSAVSTHTDVNILWLDYDDDNSPIDGGTRYFDEDNKTFTQELRFSFEYEKLNGVIGAYYFKQDIPSSFGGNTRFRLSSVGVSAPFFQSQFGLDADTANFVVAQYAQFDPAILRQDATTQQDITTQAIFTDFTYSINDKWDVFAGVRWDKETQENESAQVFSIVNIASIPDPSQYPAPLNTLIAGINQQLVANVENANQSIPLVDTSFTEVIPKVGLSYHWSNDVSTSFTLQEGYRSGGVGVNNARANVYQFTPEFTTNYEFSFRSSWLNDALFVNANVFYLDWKDQQVNVQLSENSFDSEVINAGASTVKGFELEINYDVTTNLSSYVSVGLAKSEFTDFTIVIPGEQSDTVFDLAGRSFADAPEWTATSGFVYKGDSGLFANVSMNYADSSPAETNPFRRGLREGDEQFDLQNDSRTLFNAQLGYEWATFGVYLVGKNIFDKQYEALAPFGAGQRVSRVNLGEPRQLSISLRGKF